NGALGEDDAAERLRSIEHPGLLPAETVRHTFNRLAIITVPTPETLATRLQECRAQRLPGIPRDELLARLRGAAETLDALHQAHDIEPLGLNPRNLVLLDDELRVADFGLVALLWLPAGQDAGHFNARYSAPELLGRSSVPNLAHCDQYSLALMYHELLTGT